MKLTLNKIGLLGSGDRPVSFDINHVTIMTGRNNSGKTYATYTVYGLLAAWMQMSRTELDDVFFDEFYKGSVVELDLDSVALGLDKILKHVSESYSRIIGHSFGAPVDRFSRSLVQISMKASSLKYIDEVLNQSFGSKDSPYIVATKVKGQSIVKFNILDAKSLPEKAILRDAIDRVLFRLLFKASVPTPYVISSERTGIALFLRDLDVNKNVVLEKLQKIGGSRDFNHADMFDVFREMASRYPVAVKQNINNVRDVPQWSKGKSFLVDSYPEVIKAFDEVAGGVYKVSDDKEIVFSPKGYQKGDRKVQLPMYLGSTSVRSLLDLHVYIKHVAAQGDILIMDEPELNLHPHNQRMLARLLVQLSNAGVRVFITTHSDYIIKEVSNMMALGDYCERNSVDAVKLAKKAGYTESQCISSEKVSLYTVSGGEITKEGVDRLGFIKTSFDDAIDGLNAAHQKISTYIEIAEQ